MRLRTFVKPLGRAIGIGLVEFLAVARFAPLRHVVRFIKADQLRRLEPLFDSSVYIRQFTSPWRQHRVSRDPLLHYLLIGWRETRAPNTRLDPVFLRNEMRANAASGEPLLHILSKVGRQNLAQNEVEAASSTQTGQIAGESRALIFNHSRGGGSTKFLSIFEQDLRGRGIVPVRLRLLAKSDRLLVWPDAEGQDVFDLVDDAEALIDRARRASIESIVISHVIDFQSDVIFDRLVALAAALRCPLQVILHDYLCVCPRVNLIDSRGRPCPIPEVKVCKSCVAEGQAEIGKADPMTWRPRFLAFLGKADRVIVPSEDVRSRLASFVAKPLEVWRPERDERYPSTHYPSIRAKERLSVAILGSLNEAKGSHLLLALAQAVLDQAAPIDFTVYGETDLTRKLRAVGITVKGRYRDIDLETLLKADAPHLVLMPAIWPETWSFVLTTALKRGLPVAAFEHGAQLERLRSLGRDRLLMPVDWIDKPGVIVEFLEKFRGECQRDSKPPRYSSSSSAFEHIH